MQTSLVTISLDHYISFMVPCVSTLNLSLCLQVSLRQLTVMIKQSAQKILAFGFFLFSFVQPSEQGCISEGLR